MTNEGKHYTSESLAAFVRSARVHMPPSKMDFILFVHQSQVAQPAFAAFAKENSVTLLPIDKDLHAQTIETGRIPILQKWLEEHVEEYGFVALVDSRDVYFQSDPFIGLQPKHVHIFEQETNVTFTSQVFSATRETVAANGASHAGRIWQQK